MFFHLLYKCRSQKLLFRGWFIFPLLLWSFALTAQQISFSVKKASLENVFQEIKNQTGYSFVFASEDMNRAKPVTLTVHNMPLFQAITLLFQDQPFTYRIDDHFIVIEKKTEPERVFEISGRVVNEKEEGIEGASVRVKGRKEGTSTDKEGMFILKTIVEHPKLIISSIGFESRELLATSPSLIIGLKTLVSKLDETLVIAYGTTTRRLSTGSVSKINAEEISKQPVANVLAALSGHIPGLLVTQNSGIPGASLKLQVRGQNSITQGNDPFIIIDGVPFAPNNSTINQVAGAFTFNNNGLSPFASVNPADIESIEVLKDADATAIYGSRGANGVILITTKKGSAGKTKFDFKAYSGLSKITHLMPLLNTEQYIQMRKEAFQNDGETPTATNAYDLLVWDTTRYTDFRKLLIGGTAHTTDAQASVSGGSEQTTFLISGGYHKETTVYPGNLSDNRGSLNFNLHHSSLSKKFTLNLKTIYCFDNNHILNSDLTNFINLPPNLPSLYDANGGLKWSDGGFSFNNPLAFLKSIYNAKTDNLLTNLQIDFQVARNLILKTNLGYNLIAVDEISTRPMAAQNPAYQPTGSSEFGNSKLRSLIAEPQVEYAKIIGNGKLTALAGATWQENNNSISYLNASGYTNDALLQSTGGASSIYSATDYSAYRYAAVFGRINYTLQNTYLLNLTARRDGSSRFGPNQRYANFGAAGIGWIFSNEKFFKKNASFFSYGKLRASYGITGNDAIGDYKYLDTYSSTNFPYQGTPGIYPTALFNPNYSWEKNRKMEGALELGFFKDKVLATLSFYKNKSGNQLIQYSLASQTGFSSITKNLPAEVQNSGLEVELSAILMQGSKFSWTTALNFTSPKNKLLAFPGLENSSYNSYYVIGKSLNIGNGYRFIGVDTQTGIYQFLDHSSHLTSSPDYAKDFVTGIVNLDPAFFGGLKNSLNYKNLHMDIFFEYRKQIGYSYLRDVTQPPGIILNQPVLVLNHWQKLGDLTGIQRFTQSYNSTASLANNHIVYEGASNLFTDASFIRLKNISISYDLPGNWLRKMGMSKCRVYLQGQNLLTITNYQGGDPETQQYFYLPPLKTIAAGIQLTL